MSILHAVNVHAGYRQKTVVRGLSLTAEQGDVIGILGPNGAGKTTVLRTLAGLQPPLAGEIRLNNRALDKYSAAERARLLAVVLTDRSFGGHMTVLDVVAMGRYPYTDILGRLNNHDFEVIENAVETVGCHHLLSRAFSQLSDGEKQKVLLSRALAQEPELIIMDEPTAFLDISHKIELLAVIRNLCQGKKLTVIISLHEIELAIKCCRLVLLIGDGEPRGYGYPEDLLKEETIKHLYQVKSARFDDILCSLEEAVAGIPAVFVVGGAGTAAPLYRALHKRGIKIVTGILQKNDIDCRIATALGGAVLAENAYEPVCPETVCKAVSQLEQLPVIIDTGFPVGSLNRVNIDLIRQGACDGKRILTLRSRVECHLLYGEHAKEFVYCKHIGEILTHIL